VKVYDVSMAVHPGMQVWKNRDAKRPVFTIERDFNPDGSGGRETRVAMDMHTGTHIDAPLHFIKDGITIEQVSLSSLVRPVKVLDLTGVAKQITKADLIGFDIEADDFLLLKTRNSNTEDFDFEFVFVDRTGAEYLVSKQIAGVGIDSLGIERDQEDHATHKQLLSSGIIIIEGLRLKEVPDGEYFMVAAPLKLQNVEAAPARVLLFDQNL
jgi:arylformamidase